MGEGGGRGGTGQATLQAGGGRQEGLTCTKQLTWLMSLASSVSLHLSPLCLLLISSHPGSLSSSISLSVSFSLSPLSSLLL